MLGWNDGEVHHIYEHHTKEDNIIRNTYEQKRGTSFIFQTLLHP